MPNSHYLIFEKVVFDYLLAQDKYIDNPIPNQHQERAIFYNNPRAPLTKRMPNLLPNIRQSRALQ